MRYGEERPSLLGRGWLRSLCRGHRDCDAHKKVQRSGPDYVNEMQRDKQMEEVMIGSKDRRVWWGKPGVGWRIRSAGFYFPVDACALYSTNPFSTIPCPFVEGGSETQGCDLLRRWTTVLPVDCSAVRSNADDDMQSRVYEHPFCMGQWRMCIDNNQFPVTVKNKQPCVCADHSPCLFHPPNLKWNF